MTIIQTISKADGTKRIKTELNLIGVNTVTATRIINGSIYSYTIANDDDTGPVTMKQISALTKIDDDLFYTISDETRED